MNDSIDIALTRYVSELMLKFQRGETNFMHELAERSERTTAIVNGDVELENKIRLTAWVEGERPTLGGGK